MSRITPVKMDRWSEISNANRIRQHVCEDTRTGLCSIPMSVIEEAMPRIHRHVYTVHTSYIPVDSKRSSLAQTTREAYRAPLSLSWSYYVLWSGKVLRLRAPPGGLLGAGFARACDCGMNDMNDRNDKQGG